MEDIGADWTARTGALVTRVALGVTAVGLVAIIYALWFLRS